MRDADGREVHRVVTLVTSDVRSVRLPQGVCDAAGINHHTAILLADGHSGQEGEGRYDR